MKASEQAFHLIKNTRALSLEPFLNYKGDKVIGYETSTNIIKDTKITKKEALAILEKSIAIKSRHLSKFLREAGCYPILQNQFDALVSLSYDVSLTVIALSGLFDDLKESKYISAQSKFRIWTRYRKEPVYRLIKARKMEMELFRAALSSD